MGREPWKKEELLGSSELWTLRLSNGMTLLVSPMPGSPVAAMQVWYAVGSAHESAQATGMAHFLEHMMFKGTSRHAVGEFDRIMEGMGANGGTNAFTWKDYTAYVVELPVDRLDVAIELEADRMRGLNFDQDSVDRERGVILDEKLRSLSDPESRRFDSIFSHVYQGSSMAWPILGNEEHLRALSPDSLRHFYSLYYHPAHAAIVVAGGVDPDEILQVAERCFEPIQGETRGMPLPPRRMMVGRHHFKSDISLTRLDLCLDASDITENEGLLLAKWLSGSEDSLLEMSFVHTGRAQEVSVWHCEAPGRKGALLMISAILAETEDPDIFERDLLETLSVHSEISDSALQSLGVALECHVSSILERHEDRATILGQKWIYGEPFSPPHAIDSRRLLSLATGFSTRRRFTHLTRPA